MPASSLPRPRALSSHEPSKRHLPRIFWTDSTRGPGTHEVRRREIAAATGQSESEISEILKGPQVQAYDVLVRICEGLVIPRDAMGLFFSA